jgi:hypothetical protein
MRHVDFGDETRRKARSKVDLLEVNDFECDVEGYPTQRTR